MTVEIALIELEPPSASVVIGDSVRLQVRMLDRYDNVLTGRAIEWSSSDPTRVSVDGTGLVQGVAAGHATVTAASGTSRAMADIAVNRPAPGLVSAQPSAAQRLQTLDVVLTGSNFEDGITTVDFGAAITIDAVTVTAPQSLTARVTILPGAQLGARDISVTTPSPGGGTATLRSGFTVLPEHPAPSVTTASPTAGQRQTTLGVTLTGSGFVNGLTTVAFGPGISVNKVDVQSSTALTATISIGGAAALGARDVSVTNPAPGGGSATLAAAFTVLPVNPAPAITGASPSSGQRRDVFDVTLTGSGFIQNVTTVTFGPDITVNTVQVNSPTSLTANIRIGSAATLGARSVSASNPAPGGGTGTLTNGFTVLQENPAPSATLIIPDNAPRGVTTNVTLIGTGFVQGLTSVSFGPGIQVNSVTVVFWTSLIANITIAPDAAPGPRNVTVTNPAPGGGTFIMNDGFVVM